MSQPQVAIARREPSEESLARGRRRKDKKVPGAISDSSSGSTVCDDETILRELCVVNGLNYDKLHHGSGSKVKKLEIFFFGCPRIPEGLDQFPNLLSLCIVNQRFQSISGLEGCPLLEELWICETQVKKIEGLDKCHNLVKLHLYSNCIKKIEGLEALTRLEKLWLNGNDISSLEGLEELKELKDLNLAANKIIAIGKSLSHLSQLETLNLSGNIISSLLELVHLSGLPKLRCLSLCHPMHSPNPVCCLCNYSTHTLFHFPQLRWLDGREVASQDLQKLVQGLVLRKIQYYRMKTHHCRMEGWCTISKLQDRLKGHLHHCYIKLRALSKFQKNCLDSSSAATEQVSSLLYNIQHHIDKTTKICSESCRAVETEMDQKCEFWMMELNSGGNVKLTCCEPTQPCYNSCSELIHSRFSVADAENFGICGLEVTQVVRVENRLLFNGFNDKLKSLLEIEPYSSMTTNQIYKKMVDYLFLVWFEDNTCVSSICQNGFASCPAGIWLTNSVNIADQHRLQQRAQQGHSLDKPQTLLLCKVFIGQAVETTGSECPAQAAFPSADSVFRTHGVPQQGTITDLYSKDWFVFDSSLVLPEYIIHFKYLSQHSCEDPLEEYISTHCLPTNEEIDSLVSHTPSSTGPRLAMLDEPTLLEYTGQSALASIQELNLCNNRLTRFRLASSLVQLRSLILSGNDLSTAEDFSNLSNLEVLDLSFNNLHNLQGLKSLSKLKSLDVSWNFLSSYYDDLSPLRKHCPVLQSLDTRHNPWRKKDNLRTFILARMRSLQTIDGQAVSEDEASRAVRTVVASHLSLSTLLSHADTDLAPLPTLSISPIAQTLRRPKPALTSAPSTEWHHKVSVVCLSDLGLCKLSHLDQLPNLRWLSLSNNALTSLEGLLQCTLLEELTLDNNFLTSVDGIGSLVSLQWLSVSCNQLTRLSSTLYSLSKLHYLNLSQNKLTSLQELKLVSLMELYVSDNALSTLRELFCLKCLSCLVVLDLSLNPVTSLHTYRPFVIFHLTFLKALDGKPINVGEIAGAKEKLGGQLTQDFVFQKYPNLPFKDMLKLDLPNCGIKHIDLSPVQSFINLASLNLENNSLTCFSGLVLLNQLKVLCLNHNRIEQLVTDSQLGTASVLSSLQVLHLAYNGISNMPSLQLNRIPSLRALFLQGNEISKIEGLDQLHNLTELVLDRNKIKCLQEHSFAGLDCLRELHLEENRLRDLSHFKPLPSLDRLYLGLNRIQDYNQLEKLHHLHNLTELSVMGNSVSRRLQHRVLLIYQHPALTALDGVPVSAVERQAAEMVFGGEQQECELSSDASLLPGLSGAAPLRVMNVPFSRNQHLRQVTDARAIQGHVQNVQGFHDKKKRGKN